jgi:hypothetical protein
MTRVLALLVASTFVLAASPARGVGDFYYYGWAISGSSQDWAVSTGPVTHAPTSLYLWFVCAMTDGMRAAEFGFATPPGVPVISFTTLNGFLNAMNETNLMLAVGGCPFGPVVAGYWTVLNDVAGEYCLVPSVNGLLGTVDCTDPLPAFHPAARSGYSTTGHPASCADYGFCVIPLATDDKSWGEVKSLYR